MNAIFDYLGQIPDGWETLPIVFDGIHYGDVMLQGNEIHMAVVPQHRCRGWSRRRARQFLGGLIKEKVFLTTRSMVGDSTEPFLQRLGFVKTNEDATFRYWWMDDLPFPKKAKL